MGEGDEKEHWSLMLLDTYILYNAFYIFVLILFSVGNWQTKGIMDYIWHISGRSISPLAMQKDLTRFNEHKKWWNDEAAKQRVATQGGGGNTYSIKTWTCVLLFSVFLFILAILFPSKTIDNFSTVTMPSMFRDTILDTNKSNTANIMGLFRQDWGEGKDKYTVSQNDEDDIEFIRTNAENYRKSNDEPDVLMANATKDWEEWAEDSRGGEKMKEVCGTKSNFTKLLNEDSGVCKNGLHNAGFRCHNLSQSPCCQRYCPADIATIATHHWGTYYGGANQEETARVIQKGQLDTHAPDWQCNTDSKWNPTAEVCEHEAGDTTAPVYVLVPSGFNPATDPLPSASSPDRNPSVNNLVEHGAD
uniref:Uncharacterized protein n=1 Tax=viral metagenome TaxID=1070528 RepID=A0A6C0BY91_9ZZZZ